MILLNNYAQLTTVSILLCGLLTTVISSTTDYSLNQIRHDVAAVNANGSGHSCSLINFHTTLGPVSPTNTDSPSGLMVRSCGWSNPCQNSTVIIIRRMCFVITKLNA